MGKSYPPLFCLQILYFYHLYFCFNVHFQKRGDLNLDLKAFCKNSDSCYTECWLTVSQHRVLHYCVHTASPLWSEHPTALRILLKRLSAWIPATLGLSLLHLPTLQPHNLPVVVERLE